MYRRPGIIFLAVVLGMLSFPSPSFSFLNNYFTASIVEPSEIVGKAGFSIDDQYSIFFAGAEYGLSKGINVGGRVGILDSDGRVNSTGGLLGIMGKYKAVFSNDPRVPDFALYGTYDFGFASSKILNSLTGGLIASKLFSDKNGDLEITPYLALELEVLGGSMNGSTNFNLHIPLGARAALGKNYFIYGEVKIGPDTAAGIALTHKF